MLSSLKKLVFIISISLSANIAYAHMLWLERAENGNTLAYFGEPHEAKIETSDKLAIFKDVTAQQAHQIFKGTLQNNHLLFATQPLGDVRLTAELVHKDMRVLFRAKNNSNEPKPIMDYEFMAVQGKPNTFQLIFNNQPAVDNNVMLVNPDLTHQKLITDANGQLVITIKNKGQYLLQATNMQDKAGELNGKAYKKVIYVTTLTFRFL